MLPMTWLTDTKDMTSSTYALLLFVIHSTYRDGCKKMEAAIAANNENPDTGAAQVAEVRAEVEREILIQFMQV